MELIRKILLAAENAPGGWGPDVPRIEGFTIDQIGYHVYLLVDAGLVKGVDVTTNQSPAPEYWLTCLTWPGHEFLDAARDETRWKKVTGTLLEKGESVTIGVLQGLLVAAMKAAVGLQ